MKLLQRSANSGYQVAYLIDDTKINVVKINYTSEFNRPVSCLQIQRVGLKHSVEELLFVDGRVEEYSSTYVGGSSIIPFLYEKPEKLEKLLKAFGEEFKEIFETDQFKSNMQANFKELLPYLK